MARRRHDDDESWPASSRVVHDLFTSLFGHERLRDRWIDESVSLAGELQETPPRRHAAALFCIRLYGLLREVHASTQRGIAGFDEEPSNDELEQALRELDAAIADLRGTLSRHELLWLEYQRDSESHPWLHAYDHEHISRDVVRDRRNSGLMGESVEFRDYREAIELLTTSQSADDVAASIAKRALPALLHVQSAAHRCRS